MLNLDKLNSQFDPNDLSVEQITQILGQHLNTIIKAVLIIGSLLAVGMMFNDHRNKEQSLRAQMSQTQQKIDAIQARDASDQDVNHFLASLPKKINEFQLISLISDEANAYHISIPSLSPANSRDMGLYDLIDLQFDASSDNFKDMMLFLRKIENSDFPLRINTWSGQELPDGEISFSIGISAVLIHS